MELKLKPFGFSTRMPTNCSDNNTFNNLEDYPPINFGPITNDGERGEDTLSQVEYKHETWLSDSPVSRAIERRVFKDTRAQEIEGSTIAKQESKSMPRSWKRKRTARKDGGARHWGNASTGLLQSAAENSRQEIFCPCTFVWGKVADCPWWPAEVVETEVLPPSLQKKTKSEHTPVKFIGIHKSRSNRSFALLKTGNILSFVEHLEKFSQQNISDYEGSCNFEAALAVVKENLDRLNSEHPMEKNTRKGHKMSSIWEKSKLKIQQQNDKNARGMRKRRRDVSKGTGKERLSTCSIELPPVVSVQVTFKRRKAIPEVTEIQTEKESRAKTKNVDKHSSQKRKTIGEDGYFFECVICDIGGNLICCDACPRTYHLDCLEPPLKHTPPGNWQCPTCCGHAEPPKASRGVILERRKIKHNKRDGVSVVPQGGGTYNLKHHKKEEESALSAVKIPQGRKDSPRTKDSKKMRSKGEETVTSQNLTALNHGLCGLDVRDPGSLEKIESLDMDLEVKFVELQRKQNQQKIEDENEILSYGKEKEVDCILGCRLAKKSPKLASVDNCNDAESHFSILNACKRPVLTDDENCVLKTELQNKAANVTDGNQGGEVHNLALDIAADRSFKVLRVFQRKRKKSLSQDTIQRQESSASENFVANSGPSMEFSNVNMLSSAENVVENLNREPRSAAEFTVGDVKEEQEVGNMDTSGSNILDPQNFEPGMEYLVKWVGRSHIHNDWIGESSLQVLAKRELDNYKLKYGNAACVLVEEKWHKPHRIIARRVSEYGVDEVLVKWCGLGYNECTWESVNEPIVVNNSSLIQEFEHFESIASKVEKSTSKSSTMEAGVIETVTEQPSELKGGSLFPHQMESLNWLRKCWHTRKNAILADGIGLGKAVSCCAFISCLYHEFKVTKPCLILIHLSAMPNWSAEFCAWDPSLNVIEYHGSAQERAVIREHEWYPFKSIKSDKGERACKFNVMLTTYEVIIADASHLQAIPWEILLVDERHWLKNRPSKLFHLLNTFNSTHRVLLTDTPLQNNIDEMHSLLNFLQLDTFRSLPIFEDKRNALSTAKHLEELKKVVELHMLCRLKKETIQNIPSITERIIQVDLTSLQSEYYRSLLTRNYQIRRQVDRTEQRQSMIDTVMQLRMVCSHPYIILGAEPDCGTVELRQETRIKASAKLSLLHLMLKKLKADGHRVLIFSHMTKLLDILQDYLGVEFGSKSYECIDGSKTVADCQAAIARFNRDLLQFVFLLSTRSCGLGIKLPTVDTVIIFDSDFNPYDDMQAINRAHRIGQTKRLLVYRLVVRASAEERILQLAKKKSMPDYLFTNEIGCQKEVEDILQWGTEELLQDHPRQTDDTVDISGNDDLDKEELRQMLYEDGKPRKGDGGRGGICEDASLKEGHPTTTWDAAAITRLLDRSESENETSNGEAENDMCRSLKAWDWNEQDDVSDQNDILKYDESESVIEPKSLVLGEVNEESDCDKILRKRLVKMQIEEEILGQSKRTEKMVLNKENCNIAVQEACNKSMHEDEEAQEPEYVPVGQGLEKKLDRIPARRKECNTSRDNDPEKSWDGEQLNLAARFLREKVVNQITLPIGSTHQAQSIFPQASLQGLQTSSYEGIASSHLNKLGFTSERQRVEERKVRGHNLYFPSMVGSTVGLQISSNPLPWTEEELDTLWTGVRRYGRGNWAAMLTDRRLHFSEFKSANDLAERWEKEELKLYGKPPNTCESSEQGKNTSLFGGIHLSKTPNGSMFSFGTSTPPPSKISKQNGILPNMKLLLGGPTKLGVSDDFSLFRSRVRVLNDEGRENLANIGPVSYQTRDPRAFLDFPKWLNQTIPNLSDACSERIQYMPRIRPFPISSSKFPPQTTVLPNGQSSIPSLNENYWKEGTDWGKYATMAFQNRASGNNYMPRFHDKISNRKEAGLFQGFGANSKLNKWKAKHSLTDLSPPTVREANADIGVCTGLPHWLKEAFKVEIPPQPSLPPNIVAITQALEVAFKDTKSLLPDWTRPGHAPTPPRKWIQKSKKKKKSIGRDSCKDTQYTLASNNDRSILPGMFIGGKKLKPQIPPVMGSTLLDPSSLKESGSISSSLLNLAALPKGQKGNPNFDPFQPELNPRGKKPNSFWESTCLKPQVYNFGGHASSSMRSNCGNTRQFPDVSCGLLRNPPLAPLFFGFNQALRGGQNLNSLDSFYTRNSQQAASAGNIYSFNGLSSQSMVYQSMPTKSSVLASANATVKRNINSEEGSSSKTHSDPCLLSAKETIHDDDDDDDDASSEKTISDDGSSRQ